MAVFDGARLFIGGRFQAAANVVPVIEAATEKRLGDGASATEGEIDAAVAAASAALPQWRSTPPAQRAETLNAFADALDSRASATCELISRENGMPITLSKFMNGTVTVATVRYYAQQAANLS